VLSPESKDADEPGLTGARPMARIEQIIDDLLHCRIECANY
jgi:hypothetical protein